ncbi:Transcriptional regulator, TetR family [Frankia canadensis]|uniref:Transcriptional regulator, TetR family n=1 Tax=Frankia canadensis TaxID=1836972 RepID=A0A2I2KMS2_9ACTN|nr:TetR/AcrR family transcriptional regulator [Frankia canadensis]SNQ46956.1 Transcriptional regulator, TetR family [Frankia canadensis]SOU54246.1 Transcriptional regulator, TetR family [Frankia canadensis]
MPVTAHARPPELSRQRDQRADARRNHDHLLEVARLVVAEQGVGASLRDVARRAEVGLGTLYRHFPTREALLDALLRQGFARLVELADELAATHTAVDALTAWLRELALSAAVYRGLPTALAATLDDPDSALSTACGALRRAGGQLLANAQAEGSVRPDVTGLDVFALATAVAALAEQGPLAERRDHLLGVLFDGLRPGPPLATQPLPRGPRDDAGPPHG